jgi:integrase
MRGSLSPAGDGRWKLRLDAGRDATGARRQRQVTFRGTKKAAQTKLRNLCDAAEGGTLVAASRLTLGAWLLEWIEAAKPQLRPNSYARYKGIIDKNISKASIAAIPLQKVRPTHLEAYYAGGTVSASTMALHHTVLHRALRKAVRDKLISTNPAIDLECKPRRSHSRGDARQHAWTTSEARVFLRAATDAGTQPAAFYTLALDSGMRKGELCGLRWEDVELEAGKVRVVHQLLSASLTDAGEAVFGPTKTGKVRTITVGANTVALLREWRKAQREEKMAHRDNYHDLGLVFTKVDGTPMQINNFGQREYAALIRAASVRPIKFHGLRHTCATLLLQAGTPIHVVSERLGHAKVSMTMEVYAHVLPDMQRDAAATMTALLHG